MNSLMVFENREFGKIRSMEVNGEAWFVAADVCSALEHSNVSVALERLDDDEKAKFSLGLSGGPTNCVNEYGLYSLILGSRKKEAKAFKRWVTHDVIPSIRKNGAYIAGQGTLSYDELQKVLDVIHMMQGKLDAQKPLVDFANHVAESAENIDVGTFAKILCDDGINIGRNRLYKWFKKNHYIMSDGTPYQWVINNKYMELVEKKYETIYGTKIISMVYITGKGQIYFLDKLKKQIEVLNGKY